MKIHPQVISQKGMPAFIVLPYKEYEALLNRLEDIEDILWDLDEALNA